jgi:hypothetical protein
MIGSSPYYPMDLNDTKEYEYLTINCENIVEKIIVNLKTMIKERNFYPEKDCVICYEKMDCNAYITPCGHYYCCECLDKWKKESSLCPTCKKIID